MKKIITTILIAVFVALPTFSSEKTVDFNQLDKAKNGIYASLKSDNDGVRSSAIHIIAKIKSENPNIDLTEFNKVLNKMSKFDSRTYIRANANLIYIYINSTELPKKVKVDDQEDPSIFFNALYSELGQDFIALNN